RCTGKIIWSRSKSHWPRASRNTTSGKPKRNATGIAKNSVLCGTRIKVKRLEPIFKSEQLRKKISNATIEISGRGAHSDHRYTTYTDLFSPRRRERGCGDSPGK